MKFAFASLASAIFLIACLTAYFLHINFFKVDVVFYAAIGDGLIGCITAAAFLYMLNIFKIFTQFEKFLLVMIWVISGYSLAISVPTVIDRSLSFYILEKIQQRGGGIKKDAFRQIFTDEYVKEHHLVDVRLTEQLESGSIVIIDQCVKLTKKGQAIARFSRDFRQHWLPKKRLLMGTYTDELTDPFRNSEPQMSYSCQ
jgi:hypothetical protein